MMDGFSLKVHLQNILIFKSTSRLLNIWSSRCQFSLKSVELISSKLSTVTYGHTCLCFHSIPGSTGTSCGSRSSLPACRPSCRWSCSRNNTVRQEAMTSPQRHRHGQEEEVSSNRKWPVAWTFVGGPRVRAGLFCHLVVRMWVGLFHGGGEAADRQKIPFIIHLIFILIEFCLSDCCQYSLILKTHRVDFLVRKKTLLNSFHNR